MSQAARVLSILAVQGDDGEWTWSASSSTTDTRARPLITSSQRAPSSMRTVLSHLLRAAAAHCDTATAQELGEP